MIASVGRDASGQIGVWREALGFRQAVSCGSKTHRSAQPDSLQRKHRRGSGTPRQGKKPTTSLSRGCDQSLALRKHTQAHKGVPTTRHSGDLSSGPQYFHNFRASEQVKSVLFGEVVQQMWLRGSSAQGSASHIDMRCSGRSCMRHWLFFWQSQSTTVQFFLVFHVTTDVQRVGQLRLFVSVSSLDSKS